MRWFLLALTLLSLPSCTETMIVNGTQMDQCAIRDRRLYVGEEIVPGGRWKIPPLRAGEDLEIIDLQCWRQLPR